VVSLPHRRRDPDPERELCPLPKKTFQVFDHKMVQLDTFLKIKVLYCF